MYRSMTAALNGRPKLSASGQFSRAITKEKGAAG